MNKEQAIKYIKEHYDEFECCNCNNLYDCQDKHQVKDNTLACERFEPDKFINILVDKKGRMILERKKNGNKRSNRI